MRTVHSRGRESAISKEFMHENQKKNPLVDREQKKSKIITRIVEIKVCMRKNEAFENYVQICDCQ